MNKEDFFLSYHMKFNKGKLFFLAETVSTIYSIDTRKGYLDKLYKPPFKGWFRSFVEYNGKLLLFSNGCDGGVCSYDIEKKEYIFTPLPKNIITNDEYNWAANYIRNDNCLYFCWASPIIIRYNMENGEWKTYRNWKEQLSEYNIIFEGFNTGGFIYNHKVYIHIKYYPYFLLIDLETDSTSIQKISNIDNKDKVLKIIYDDNCIWIQSINENNCLHISKALLNDMFAESTMRIQLRATQDTPSFLMGLYKNKMLLLPENYDEIFEIDTKNKITRKIEGIKLFNVHELYTKGIYHINYLYLFVFNETIYAINVKTGEMICINMEKGFTNSIKLILKERERMQILSHELEEKGYCQDGNITGLNDFISII